MAEFRELAALVAALYEDAGLPAPVILERPDLGTGRVAHLGGLTAGITSNGSVELGYGSASDLVTPARARQWAATVAAVADLAEVDEPDPAEAEELAALMDAEMERRGAGQFGLYPACARIALRWFRDRQQQGEVQSWHQSR